MKVDEAWYMACLLCLEGTHCGECHCCMKSPSLRSRQEEIRKKIAAVSAPQASLQFPPGDDKIA